MKNIGKLILATSIMMIFAMQSEAQPVTKSAKQTKKIQNSAQQTPASFVDTNKNGICDNFESRQGKGRGGNFVDKDKDGICDNFKNRPGQGQGRNYVDKNGDGVCDNRANVGKKSGNQCRKGYGRQHRRGNGQGQGKGQGQGLRQGQVQKSLTE